MGGDLEKKTPRKYIEWQHKPLHSYVLVCHLHSLHSSYFYTLGTYDVQSVSFEPVAGAVTVSGELARNTHALGCFFIFKSSLADHYQTAVNENDSCNTTVSNLERGNYSVLVYDLEEDGLPESTPVAMPVKVMVNKSICNTTGQLRY